MMLRLVIFLLRRVLGGLLIGIVMTLLGGGRTARQVIRWGRVLRRIVRL